MSRKKQLWILAGGNGVGKSTFYRTRLAPKGSPFINADILAKQLYPHAPELHSYDAAILAAQLRSRLLLEGNSFCFGTIFSHPSKIDFIAQAKTIGYNIILVFIHLDDASLNQARVAQRVSEGGHDVPSEKIINRIPRVLKYIRQAIPLCDRTYILDNSRADNPFQQYPVHCNGQLNLSKHSMPIWLKELLTDYLEEI